MKQDSAATQGQLQGSPGQAALGPKPGFLGVSTEELAGLSVDELVGNKQAVTMVLHYYKQLSEENASLKNDLNTAETYVSGYVQKRSDVSIGAWIQFVASVFFAFAVNILTSDAKPTPGVLLLIAGIAGHVLGLYVSLRRENK